MVHTEKDIQDILPTIGVKNYNAMTDDRNLFDQPVRNNF